MNPIHFNLDLSGFTLPVVLVWETDKPETVQSYPASTGKQKYGEHSFFLERCTDDWRRFDYCQWSDEDGSTAIADGLIQMQFVHIPSPAQQQISLHTTAEGRRELAPIHTELSRYTKVWYALRLNSGTQGSKDFIREKWGTMMNFAHKNFHAIIAGQAKCRTFNEGHSVIDFCFRSPNLAMDFLQNNPIAEPVDEPHS